MELPVHAAKLFKVIEFVLMLYWSTLFWVDWQLHAYTVLRVIATLASTPSTRVARVECTQYCITVIASTSIVSIRSVLHRTKTNNRFWHAGHPSVTKGHFQSKGLKNYYEYWILRSIILGVQYNWISCIQILTVFKIKGDMELDHWKTIHFLDSFIY